MLTSTRLALTKETEQEAKYVQSLKERQQSEVNGLCSY